MPKFYATGIFHHPNGVVCPGETVDLSADIARRGLDAGVLIAAQPKPKPQPAPVAEDVVPDLDPQKPKE